MEPFSSPGQNDNTKLTGRVLDGRYALTRYIAHGGMGAVYEATDEQTGDSIAVKLLIVETEDQLFRRRFFNEAAMAATLDHPRAVRVFDYGSDDDGTCYMTMELLEGEPFQRYLKRASPLPVQHALRVARDICAVLIEAHSKGFVHRDLKPSNLFVTGEDERGPVVKVLDFGLAKRVEGVSGLTVPGTMLGSPAYMSPEQLHGNEIGPQTDIYNVGLLLFKMLTGKAPFSGSTQQSLLIAQATHPPPALSEWRPDLASVDELEWVVNTCLEKQPKQRFSRVELLDEALATLSAVIRGDHEPVVLTLRDGELLSEAPPAPPRREPWRKAALFGLVLGGGLFLIGSLALALGLFLLLRG